MFNAIVAVCISVSGIPTTDCVIFADNFGPYITRDECNTRIDEMFKAVEHPSIAAYIYNKLEQPESLIKIGKCLNPNEKST